MILNYECHLSLVAGLIKILSQDYGEIRNRTRSHNSGDEKCFQCSNKNGINQPSELEVI